MRASRLLRMLLLLQNRGRMTTLALARELEVARRTVLRDIDALTEAGLPVITHRGQQGGVELGFNYRTRLTGLAADEAEALAVILSRPSPELDALGMTHAGARAVAKMLESFPDGVHERIERARSNFRFEATAAPASDPRVGALAEAVRGRRIVRIRARAADARIIHPVALVCGAKGWRVVDALAPGAPVQLADCADIVISARRFRDDGS